MGDAIGGGVGRKTLQHIVVLPQAAVVMVQVDAADFQRIEGIQLTRIGYTISVGVYPHTQLFVNSVRRIDLFVAIGDRGVLGVVEVNRAFEGRWMAGAFYDAGYIENSVNRSATQTWNFDTLQAAGLQLQGQYRGLSYNLTWAKGLGGYKSWQSTNIESRPNNQRFMASATYAF